MTGMGWLLFATETVAWSACALVFGWLVLRLFDALLVRIGWLTRKRCALCGAPILAAWADTDEWRASHYCPICLWGPPPERSP